MVSAPQLPDHSAPPRDPHLPPDFDSKTTLATPTLYLPPLLSSLPKHISHQQPPIANFPPLITETRLPDIDPASLSLHKALHRFRPLAPNYASVPYSEAFNWSELVLPEEEEREWYCVVFRSKKKSDRDDICMDLFITIFQSLADLCCIALYDADRLAHEEAVTNGGVRIPF